MNRVYDSTYLIVRGNEIVFRAAIHHEQPAQTFRDRYKHLIRDGDEIFVRLGGTFLNQVDHITQDNGK